MDNRKVIWQPLQGTSQELAMICPASTILYHGTRGVGKTDVQIMRFRASVGIGYGRYWRGLITDMTYNALDDIVSKTKKYFSQFNDGAKFLSSKGDYRWVWKTGEELLLRSVSSEQDYFSLHGQEFAYIGVNEVSKLPSLDVIDLLSSLNRTSFIPAENPLPDGSLLPEIPMCMFLTTNPSGPSRIELKKRFIDKAAQGEVFKTEAKLFNPRTQQEEIVTKTQCHIFGSWMENSKLAVAYIADLNAISDPVKRKQWLLGDWGATDDNEAIFADVWDYDTHVVKPFDIPKEWKIDRTGDWGQSAPSSILYFAESNGEDITLPNGKTRSTVKGDLFIIGEIFTCVEGKNNIGTNLLPHELATEMVKYELLNNLYGRVQDGVCDTAMFSVVMGNSVAGMMQKPVTVGNKVYQGIRWRRYEGLKKAGSRVEGILLFRERLFNSKINKDKPYRDKPGIFIFNTCKDYLEIVPSMMRDKKNPDDVDGGNDHQLDATRYKLLSMNAGGRSGKTVGLG